MAFFSAKHAALSIGGAAILAFSGAGLSYAQSAPTSTSTSRAVIDDAAAKLGLTGDQLAQALKDARKELGAGAPVHLDRKHALSVAAASLGFQNASDVKALRGALAGTTLTALAQQRGIQPTVVASAIINDLDAQVDALVSAGKLNTNRAAHLKQKLSARVNTFMTHQFKAAKSSS